MSKIHVVITSVMDGKRGVWEVTVTEDRKTIEEHTVDKDIINEKVESIKDKYDKKGQDSRLVWKG